METQTRFPRIATFAIWIWDGPDDLGRHSYLLIGPDGHGQGYHGRYKDFIATRRAGTRTLVCDERNDDLRLVTTIEGGE